jgi:hypothetical protein
LNLKIKVSKMSSILIGRIKNKLNESKLIVYNQSDCVNMSYSLVKQFESSNGKNVDWEGINRRISSQLSISKEEMKLNDKITTLSLGNDAADYICKDLTNQLKNIYKQRVYPSTALNFLLAAAYLQLTDNIDK